MSIAVTTNENYTSLDTATKALVLTAVTAIRNAYFEAAKTTKKANVKCIFIEIVRAEEEVEAI